MTAPTGKPKGRPKKAAPWRTEPATILQNPDELPATQGYVKCVARKINRHTHTNNVYYVWTAATAVFAWMVILGGGMIQALGCGGLSGCVYRNIVPSEIWYAIIAIAIVTTVIVADAYSTDSEDTNRPSYAEDVNTSIEKWKPEKCKEKEC